MKQTKNLKQRLKWVYSLIVGNDNDQDIKTSFFGLFDYITFFIPFLLNRLVVNLLKTDVKLPLQPMLTGMLFVVNWFCIAARHLVGVVLTAALSPMVAIGHGIVKCFCHPESSPKSVLSTPSSSARMRFTPSTNHDVKEAKTMDMQQSNNQLPNEIESPTPSPLPSNALRAF